METPQTFTPTAPYYDRATRAEARARFHRAMNILLGVALLVAPFGYALIANQVSIFPFVIATREGETVQTVGIIPTVLDVTDNPGVVFDVLSHWLPNVRQITTDPVAWDQLFTRGEAYMTSRAVIAMRTFKGEQREKLQRGWVVSVSVIAFAPIAGTMNRTWELDWREQTVSEQGYSIAEESGVWHATVKVAQLPPVKLKTPASYINAQRVYIEEFLPEKRGM